MFPIIPPTKTSQMVSLWQTKWPQRKIFKRHLLNHWSKFKIISHKFPHNALYQNYTRGSTPPSKTAIRTKNRNIFNWHLNYMSKFKLISQNYSSKCLLPKLHNWFRKGEKRAVRVVDKKYLQTTSPEPLVQIQNNFTDFFLIMPSPKTQGSGEWSMTPESPCLITKIDISYSSTIEILIHLWTHHFLAIIYHLRGIKFYLDEYGLKMCFKLLSLVKCQLMSMILLCYQVRVH